MSDPLEEAGLWQRLAGRYPPHQVPFAPADRPDPRGLRHLALVLAYAGEGLAGWQLQPRKPTIQGHLEKQLSRLCDHPVRVAGSGRTDAGVHAWGQVASFATESRLELGRMRAGLASLLPQSLYLRALGPVDPAWHPRFDALAKTYDYYLAPGLPFSPFLARRVWTLEQEPSREAVEGLLARLPGARDLRGLASRGIEVEGDTRRVIHQAELMVEPGGLWRVRVTASGFLRHVVRNLVGACWQVGRGRLDPELVLEALNSGQRTFAGPKAPPWGLYLSQVWYRPWAGPSGQVDIPAAQG